MNSGLEQMGRDICWLRWRDALNQICRLPSAIWQVQCAHFYLCSGLDQALQHLLRCHVTGLKSRHFFTIDSDVCCSVTQQDAHIGFLLQSLPSQHKTCALSHSLAAVDIDEQVLLSGSCRSKAERRYCDKQSFFHGVFLELSAVAQSLQATS